MYAFPGKKLLFMVGEFAQDREWDFNGSLSWHLLNDPMHRGVQNSVRDLNRVYRETAALYEQDYNPEGFEWIDADNADESIFTFIRYAKDRDAMVVAVSNFTPVPRENYRIGVPKLGRYVEVFNSDAEIYGGHLDGYGDCPQRDCLAAYGRRCGCRGGELLAGNCTNRRF